MYFNREFSSDFFSKKIYTSEFLIITTDLHDTRSAKLINDYPFAKYVSIDYDVCKLNDNTLSDSFTTQTNFTSDLNGQKFNSLYRDLLSFIEQINKESKYLLIDISSFHLRFLGSFLALLSTFNWSAIICSYTESIAYPMSKEIDPVHFENLPFYGAFDLNSSFWGYDEIPNLKTTTSKRDNFIWIAFLGFEGKRSAAVYTEISDDSSLTLPVITMPSVMPGWANYTFEANQILFESARINCSDIDYIDATDPFSTYNYIESVQHNYPKRHLIISPLGTKPVSLGAILYACKNEDSEIYFDTPKKMPSTTLCTGKTHFYDILSFFN